jgi:spermidine synthase
LPIVIFLTSSVGMAVEMIGSRMLAPHLGTSINIWAALISVILGCLSFGYWAGGKLSSHNPRLSLLASFLLGAALFTALIPLVGDTLLTTLSSFSLDSRLQALLGCLTLFAIPTTLMGAVSPYAIRLRMTDLESSGETVGNLYSISAIGSIVGTLGTGFFLIQYLTVNANLYLLACLLFLAALLSVGFTKPKRTIATALVIGFSLILSRGLEIVNAQSTGIIDESTLYNRVQIIPIKNNYFGKPITLLRIGKEWSSSRFTDGDPELVFPYTKYYRLQSHFNPNPNRVLMIGGAGYSYPQDFLRQFPTGNIDVAEIDPGVTQIARRYFHLKDDPRLTIFHQDGRIFLNTTTAQYDAILGDAFHSSAVPFQLTTHEAVQKMYEHLTSSGVVIMNIISSINGPTSQFLQAEYATYKDVFPQVYLFPVTDSHDGQTVQNIILLASKTSSQPLWTDPNRELNEYLSHRWTGLIPYTPPLTDQLAPVERYMGNY